LYLYYPYYDQEEKCEEQPIAFPRTRAAAWFRVSVATESDCRESILSSFRKTKGKSGDYNIEEIVGLVEQL
jgi:hypothetical protein